LSRYIVKKKTIKNQIFSYFENQKTNIDQLHFNVYPIYMALSDRIRTIINECGLTQKEFAKNINVTDSYISKVLKDESGMANSTALLIEQLYNYSKNWIMTGDEPKFITGKKRNLSILQKKIIMDVEQMKESELKALLAFIESLKKIETQTSRKQKTH
jgi:transcriptional regulator with XRE-family HTH domain